MKKRVFLFIGVFLIIIIGYYIYESNQTINLVDMDQVTLMNSSSSGGATEPIQLVEAERQVEVIENGDGENKTYEYDIYVEDNMIYLEIDDQGYIVDRDEFLIIISKYKCKRSWTEYFPYSDDLIDVSFSFNQGAESRYVLLGEFNIMYIPGGEQYEIIDGDVLRDEILGYVD